MNCLVLILIAACPFWISDIVFRFHDVAPPLWIGDGMAISLMIIGAIITGRSWFAFGKLGVGGDGKNRAPLRTAPAPTFESDCNGWEQSLPCLLHEMRNYSCTLRGNAQLLRLRTTSEDILEPLRRLERTTEKIECLAAEILNATSIGTICRNKALNIGNLVHGCINDHFPDMAGAIRIESDGILPPIYGDCLKLERVFINLFRNALEAGAGRVIVRMAAVPSCIRIMVEDDGPGCPPAHIEKIFRPLFTTKKGKGGTGLGLYLVRAVLEAHGGTIRAVSKNGWGNQGKGMIFRLELPRPVLSAAGSTPGNFESRPGVLEASLPATRQEKP
jgi:signal transduction histidine kinase